MKKLQMGPGGRVGGRGQGPFDNFPEFFHYGQDRLPLDEGRSRGGGGSSSLIS